MSYDITQQAVADTAPIHIKGADGVHLYHDKKPVRIIVYGPGSDAFAEVDERQTARAIKRREDNDGKLAIGSKEEREAELAEDLATLTVGFENLSYPPAGDAQGKELFRALYADKKLGFIAAQVQKTLRDWGNFKSSSNAG